MNIKHDGVFDIAIGRSRKETSWKNKEMSWSDFVTRVIQTHRTAETHAEYMRATKSRQDEIKDVGGFVGGYIHGGRRKAGSVMHRQLITLDIDFGTSAFWDDFELMYGNAAVLYSTHKHSAQSARLRLIMPLDRAVRPDEYEAISRRIAGVLGIELFDPTTFQSVRLMYWPSTSSDGEYVFKQQDGEWLCADEILASYHDWRDCSSWPMSAKVDKQIHSGMDKQGDPLEKAGLVGAFCRLYSIHDVMDTFLADVYSPCDGDDGRYTYREGSTAGGLVVYDDKFAYSHHGTDPTSGKLCNAFDLVRIHLFGLRDEDSAASTPINKKPSYLAMLDFTSKDAKLRSVIAKERNEEALRDFASMGNDASGGGDTGEAVETEVEVVEDDSWREKLDIGRKGEIYGTIDNICLILENDRYFKGRIAYDDFEKCEVAVRDLPWRKTKWNTRRLMDRDDANIRHYLEKAYGISHLAKTKDAMQVWAQKTVFHPVRDYLNGLEWDGESRVESLLIDYQGAEDSDYVRIVTRKSLAAAVARVMNPGCKYDTILTLVGKQGLKKSTLIAKLGGRWYSDSFSFNHLNKNETKACEQVQGVWILELAELAGLAKAEIETVKHFVSKTEDIFRVAYGHRTERFPRQCIFFATTNKMDFLRDPTGNRRYWPIQIGKTPPHLDVFKDLTQEEIDQVWAEAVHIYNAGESLYLSESMVEVAAEIQRLHTEEHPWHSLIQSYLEILLPENWDKLSKYDRAIWLQDSDTLNVEGVNSRQRVCVQEIWYEALGERRNIDERSSNIIRNVMAHVSTWREDYNQSRCGIYGRQRRSYVRIPSKAGGVTGVTAPSETPQKKCLSVTSVSPQKNGRV